MTKTLGLVQGINIEPVSAEQMEIARLRAERGWTKMEREVLGEAMGYLVKAAK